jgi:hypothetical protein
VEVIKYTGFDEGIKALNVTLYVSINNEGLSITPLLCHQLI